MRVRCVFLLTLLFLFPAPTSKAALIEATFSGTITGSAPYGGEPAPYSRPFSSTFTANFIFDTSLGAIEQIAPGVYQLTDTAGEASASIVLAMIAGHPYFGSGPRTYSIPSPSYARLIWQDGLGPTLAQVDYGYQHIQAVLNGEADFQIGLCPSSYQPCGRTFATSSAFVDASPVPGPIVGAGLPGLLVAIASCIGWRRSRHNKAA